MTFGISDTDICGVEIRHHHRMDVISAQRVDCNRKRQCRINSTRKTKDSFAKPCLGKVIANPGDKRLIQQRIIRWRIFHAVTNQMLAIPNHIQLIFGEEYRLRDNLTVAVYHKRPTIEDQLILATDEIHISNWHPIDACPMLQMIEAFTELTLGKRRCIDNQNQIHPESTGRLNNIRNPDVLAHQQTHTQPVEITNHGLGSGDEISPLIKDLIVRQGLLMVGQDMLAISIHQKTIQQ